MELTVTSQGEQAYFQISGTIDESGAEDLKERFFGLNLSSIKEAVFNFSNVQHIGSSGLGKLLLFYKKLSVNNGKIRIENPNNEIRNLLMELKLNTLFTIA